ncbi:glycogen synthase GlgA [Bradyrhizobium sp.]|jgi:starch synthase|uniref:glycogen synthase GlgA n=1 Tax=Bradyrhizobium sp. TaxID=376 RepID=UPI00391B6132
MGERRKAHDPARRGRQIKPGSGATFGADPVLRSHPRILFVTSEFADYVKVGGLGEVSAALPRALRSQCDIRVLIPGYREVVSRLSGVETVSHLPSRGDIPACDLVRSKTRDGLVVYVMLCPQLFERDGALYNDATGRDWEDNDLRFARLGLAAAQIASGTGDPNWIPDLLHLNDWTSALAPAYLAWNGRSIPSVLTIHNLTHRGLFARHRLDRLGIPHAAFDINGVEFCGDISFLKAGIFYASHITTVSSTYAREIVTPEHGCGLHGLLRGKLEQGRLTGIINGIDESWDPLTDPHLAQSFSSDNWQGKDANAQALRKTFGLAVSRGPLFAIVSRLVHQKGLDIAIEAIETIVRQGGQIVVTGKGESELERSLCQMAKQYPGKVSIQIGYEETTARQMLAGSDFLLMPSRFEPCGLTQMYAQRFGSLPVAHRTGGLADTIQDGVTGLLFGELSLGGLLGAIYRSLDVYHSPSRLRAMRKAAMARPTGWNDAAANYASIYNSTLTAA